MKFKYLVLVYIVFYIIKFSPILTKVDKAIYITALDVGQGDAFLVTSPNNKHILLDGGPDFEVDNLIFNVMPLKCSIDIIVLTHPHKDHFQGLSRILDRCTVGTLFLNSVTFQSTDYQAFIAKTSNLNTKPLYAGQKFNIDSLTFYVLWPTREFVSKPVSNANLLSIVLLMDAKDTEALFMGDLENPIISRLNSNPVLNLINGRLEFYKAAHHGSTNGLNRAFISSLKPHISVISLGEGNSYNHPHKEVTDFFKTFETTLYRTDKAGTIKINISNLPK